MPSFVQILMFLSMLAPGSKVYVQGHSRAADRARENMENLTCYSSAADPGSSVATLQVDHLFAPASRRSWVVLVLTDPQRHVLFEKKGEENPWPLPSTLDRLLKSMAKSTCRQSNLAERRPITRTHSQAPATALLPLSPGY